MNSQQNIIVVILAMLFVHVYKSSYIMQYLVINQYFNFVPRLYWFFRNCMDNNM